MKIAIVGGAPSSCGLAPYNDPSWIIYACSPNSLSMVKRSDEWFEIHPWKPGERQSMDFVMHLAMHKGPVWMIEPKPEVPTAVAYPKDAMVQKFGKYFFTSSISWMAAKAIDTLEQSTDEEKVLGFWGVDLQAADEYQMQRGGCHYFIVEAERRGIKVQAAPESDILAPPPLYGFFEMEPGQVKIATKLVEMRRKEEEQKQAAIRAQVSASFFEGARHAFEYLRRTELK